MTTTLEQVLTEAKNLTQAYAWGEGYQSFWKQLEEGSLEPKFLNQYLEELSYYKQRSVTFNSTVFHSLPIDTMFSLSTHFVANVKTVWSLGSSLPLPATEAFCNKMLQIAETDPESYLVASVLVGGFFAPLQSLLTKIDDEKAAKYITLLTKTPAAVEESMRKATFPLTAAQRMNILRSVYLLLETADLVYDELVSEYQKFDLTI